MRFRRILFGILALGGTLTAFAIIKGPDDGRIPLRVDVAARSISKLPFVIAADQGLYEKYGLDVALQIPPPDFEGGRISGADGLFRRTWRRLRWQPEPPFDILVDGWTPYLVRETMFAREPDRVALAGTDCVVRAHIIARHGINSLEELKGQRVGVSILRATSGFVGLLLADAYKDVEFGVRELDIRDVDLHGVELRKPLGE